MEFLPGLISRLDPSTNSGFILTLLMFAGVGLSAWPKIRIKMVDAKERIEESETAKTGRRLSYMQSELEYLQENFEDLREETRQLHDYAQYSMRAMRRVEIFLASKGIEFPPPPFEDYGEWVRNSRDDESHP